MLLIGGHAVQGGKVSRLKKAQKWTKIAVDSAHKGIGLAQAVGGDKPEQKREPSLWIQLVKHYTQKHGITYKEVLSSAGGECPKYKAGRQTNTQHHQHFNSSIIF